MLLVNSFNPAVRNFNSKNISVNNNSRPVVFQSQPDTVSFKSTSKASYLKNKYDTQVEKLAQRILKKIRMF